MSRVEQQQPRFSISPVSGLGSATPLPALPSILSLPLLPVGAQFDVRHLRNTPDLLDEIPRHAHLVAGVNGDDRREPTRGWADRVLPGDGATDLPAVPGVLEDVGWEGFHDLEIFSDNGAFGSAHPDSLWDLDAAELARRGRNAFARCWSKRRVTANAVGRRGET